MSREDRRAERESRKAERRAEREAERQREKEHRKAMLRQEKLRRVATEYAEKRITWMDKILGRAKSIKR
jgi:hypothetical protein